PIRAWCAGCSSGEEPYTLLMLLAEAMGESGLKERVKIYATDVDSDALAQGREAIYSPAQLEPVPEDLRARYFQAINGSWCVRPELRRCVIFGRNDLHRDPPISRVDLLLCRNTLMYFDSSVQERILGNFAFALNRGGYLVAGKAESFSSGRGFFSVVDLKRRVFVKDRGPEASFRLPA